MTRVSVSRSTFLRHKTDHGPMDHVSAFMAHMAARNLSKDTIRRRLGTLQQWTQWRAPGSIHDALPEDVEEFLGQWASASTRRAYLGDLRAFYRWGCRRRGLTTDPTADVDPVKVPRTYPRPLTEDEYLMAVSLAHDPRVKTALLLSGSCGLRRSEVVAIHTADLILDGPHPTVIVRAGKGKKDRAVPLSPFVVSWLRTVCPRTGWLLEGRTPGAHLSPDRISGLMRSHLDALGIPGNLHRGRHRFATAYAAASGGNMRATADILGHASMEQAAVYTAMVGAEHRDVIDRMPVPSLPLPPAA